jgi:hypothetical protein
MNYILTMDFGSLSMFEFDIIQTELFGGVTS